MTREAASEPGWRSVALWVQRESAAWDRRLGPLKTMLEAGDGGA
jgi:hypothetical protein